MARQEADQRNAAQEAAAAANQEGGGGAAGGGGAGAPGDTLPPGGAAPAPRLPSFYSEDTPASANEMWQRLHSDPLFAIKQQVRALDGLSAVCSLAAWQPAKFFASFARSLHASSAACGHMLRESSSRPY